jgi:hypothetical protein
MLPTLLAAAGEPDIVEKCKKGYKAGKRTYKVHLDGYNLIPLLNGKVAKSPRPGFMYWGDDGDLMAIRFGDWKVHFAVQRAEGLLAWQEPLVPLRFPLLVNLRTDPFENAEVAGNVYYNKWRIDHVFAFAPAGALVAQFMASMKEFPQRQSPDSFSPEKVLEEMRRQQAALETGSGAGVK